jgi:hypothetical protein
LVNEGGFIANVIPNGTLPTTVNGVPVAYPNGPNGSVTATFNNMACFSFTDGHAKSMIPAASDPDPVNQPQNNMWDGLR